METEQDARRGVLTKFRKNRASCKFFDTSNTERKMKKIKKKWGDDSSNTDCNDDEKMLPKMNVMNRKTSEDLCQHLFKVQLSCVAGRSYDVLISS